MTDMTTLVPALKREVAPPGQYDTQYPGSTDEELAAYLMDGLAFAQLEGYLLLCMRPPAVWMGPRTPTDTVRLRQRVV